MEKSIIEKIVSLFKNETPETPTFADIKTIDGKILRVSELAFEGTVSEISEEGMIALEDGKYTLEDNKSITVKDGKITEVFEEVVVVAVEDEPEAEAEVEVEAKELTDETLAVGDLVVAEEGDHELEDGTIVKVDAESIVVEIVAKEEEEVEVEPEAEAEVDLEAVLLEALEGLKEKFESVELKLAELESENKELKNEVSKFGKAPSVTPTKTKVDFAKNGRQSKLEFFAKK